MVFRVACPVIIVWKPAQESEQVEERPIQSRVPEYPAVHQLMLGIAHEGANGAVQQQHRDQQQPGHSLLHINRHGAGNHHQAKEPTCLAEPLCVAALIERLQLTWLYLRPVPVDYQVVVKLGFRS